MVFWLVFLTACFAVLAFLINKDFFSPWSLMTLSLLSASIIIACNIRNWEVRINSRCLLCVVISILSWGTASLLTKGFSNIYHQASPRFGKERQLLVNAVDADTFPALECILLISFISAVYLLLMLRSVGLSGGIRSAIRAIYDRKVETGSSGNFITNQLLHIITAFAYICTYQFFSDFFSRRKVCLRLMIPGALFILCVMVSSDRNIFVRFCIYMICIAAVIYKNTSVHTQGYTNFRIFIAALAAIGIVMIVFFVLGKAKQYSSNFTRSISIYMGSGLYNFNLFIENFNGVLLQKGDYTLYELKSLLRTLGLLKGVSSPLREEFINYVTLDGYVYSSNIYSALRPNVEDFGYFGVMLFPAIQGVFFETLYQHAKYRTSGFAWIIYSKLATSVVYFAMADQFFHRMNLGIVYEIMWLFILYYAIYSRCGFWKHGDIRLIRVSCLQFKRKKIKLLR